jgi:hypothetical protein
MNVLLNLRHRIVELGLFLWKFLPLKSTLFGQKFLNRKSISEQWSPQNPVRCLGFIPVLSDITHLCPCLFFLSVSVFCLLMVSVDETENFGGEWISMEKLVVRYSQGKTKLIGEKHVQVPLHPPWLPVLGSNPGLGSYRWAYITN